MEKIQSPRIVLEKAVELTRRGERFEFELPGERSSFIPVDAVEAVYSRYHRRLFGPISLQALNLEESMRGFQLFLKANVTYDGQHGNNHVLGGVALNRRENGQLLLPNYFVKAVYDNAGNLVTPPVTPILPNR